MDVRTIVALLAGYNRCIWGKKDYYNYYYLKTNMYCFMNVFCLFRQARTDWQLHRFAIAFGLCHNLCTHMWKMQLKIQFAIPFKKKS